MNLKSNIRFTLIAGLLIAIFSCERTFEYSPYQADVKSEYLNTTSQNLQQIQEMGSGSADFTFAFISDSHFQYDNLRKVIDDINGNEVVQFVLFGGDMADQGILKDYEIFHELLEKLEKPYLTVIGNHDYLSNGKEIYKKMFGDLNYSFEFNNSKFIMFDDIFWESNMLPDFNWLDNELEGSERFEHVFVVAHIPPFGDQFDTSSQDRYREMMASYDVSLSLHGHTHRYLFEEPYSDGVDYLVVPSLKEPEYGLISIENGEISVILKALD